MAVRLTSTTELAQRSKALSYKAILGFSDRDNVYNSVDALENCWELMNIQGSSRKASCIETILHDKARILLGIQKHEFKTLPLMHFKNNLLGLFKPFHYFHHARQALVGLCIVYRLQIGAFTIMDIDSPQHHVNCT